MSKKSKKKGDKVLLLPGASGWEIWKGPNGTSLTLSARTEEHRALDIDGMPGGELTMAFPIREVSAMPFRAPTTDDALFGDMADMHVERLGMRPAIDFGVLSDTFKVGTRGEETVLLPVVLAPPLEGALPKRAPAAFDVSARCLPVPAGGVVLWRELGRWVFALGDHEQPLHFQAMAAKTLSEEAGREVRLTLSQLEMQGLIEQAPKMCTVWIGEEEASIPREELDVFAKGFGGSASIVSKPIPQIPPKPSQLLPADVRAERRAKRQKQQTTLLVAAAVLAYLGLIGFLVFKLNEEQKKAAAVERDLNDIRPLVFEIQDHKVKWGELKPVTELKHWPVELLLQCTKARPDGGLRLERADINNQLEVRDDGSMELLRNIRLQGSADELGQVNSFQQNLVKSDNLREYAWTTPPAAETKKGTWGFVYDGVFEIQ